MTWCVSILGQNPLYQTEGSWSYTFSFSDKRHLNVSWGPMAPASIDQSLSDCQTDLPGLWPCWLHLIKFGKKEIIVFIVNAKLCVVVKCNQICNMAYDGKLKSHTQFFPEKTCFKVSEGCEKNFRYKFHRSVHVIWVTHSTSITDIYLFFLKETIE